MKIAIALFAILVPAILAAPGRNLEGCPSGAVLASALNKLQQFDWSILDSAKVRAIWPGELKAVACDAKESGISLGTQGRVIEGDCECCETFDFHYTNTGSRSEALAHLVIRHKVPRRDDVVTLARMLAKAAGLKDVEARTIRDKQRYYFQWEIPSQQRFFALEVQFLRQGGNWNLYLTLGRDSLQPDSRDNSAVPRAGQ